jgi:hypothetical protein
MVSDGMVYIMNSHDDLLKHSIISGTTISGITDERDL